jgi:threonine synthase
MRKASMDEGSLLTHLECARCRARQEADRPATLCPACGGPLFARYDLERGRTRLNALSFGARGNTLWRYGELLPVRDERHVVTLGEGLTPLLHLARLGSELGLRSLLVKDEGRNPTGTIKARGLSVAVSRALELGARRFTLPTAGNAGAALAAYAAAAGVPASVVMPRDAPAGPRDMVERAGAALRLVDGTIVEAQRLSVEEVRGGAFDLRSLHEPYRVEGKKTIGFELAEALGWTPPDVVLVPTGDGAGLLGIWKAFEELDALGLIGRRRPRLVAVQSEGCAPVVRAWEAKSGQTQAWPSPKTIAAGIRVPDPLGGPEMLKALRDSHGRAVAVPETAIVAAARRLASKEGVFAGPEGAAAVAALERLVADGSVESKESVVVVNTGSASSWPAGPA